MPRRREGRERGVEKKDQGKVVGRIKGVGEIFSQKGKQRYRCLYSDKPTTNLVILGGKEIPLHVDHLDQAEAIFASL